MIQCGSQCRGCDYPIHFDTYSGCSHSCEYCFANEKADKSAVVPLQNVRAVKSFINGKRTLETRFCDWKIPLHWGATSDPFQPAELKERKSLECLEIFAETGYPFIVSTKGVLLAESPYIDLLSRCNAVVQMSAACAEYDEMEKGAPCFDRRMEAVRNLSPRVTRVIVRIQPYFPKYLEQIKGNMKLFADCGVYGIIIEGYSTRKKSKIVGDMEYNGFKFQYMIELLAEHFKAIKDAAHDAGLRFFCGESRLQFLGDDLTCCGTEGLTDFQPNKFNLMHLAYDDVQPLPTDAQQQPNTSRPFRSRLQTTAWENHIRGKSFAEMMYEDENYIEWAKELKRRYA